jgi:polyferredoxin
MMAGVLLTALVGLAVEPPQTPATSSPSNAVAICQPAPSPEMAEFKATYQPICYPSRAQGWFIADSLVLLGLLISGALLVRTNQSVQIVKLHLLVALAYFGLFRGGCICPVGSVANVSLGVLHPEQVGRATLALFILPLFVALFAGRVFCGTVCPLGALQHVFIFRGRYRQIPRLLDRVLRLVPLSVLIATAWLASFGITFLICRLDPFKPLFFLGHALVQKVGAIIGVTYAEPCMRVACDWTAWGTLVCVLLLGFLIPLPFCRFVCPYGVLLGLISKVAFWQRRIEASHCVLCKQCVSACPTEAIQWDSIEEVYRVNAYKCVQCGRCSSVCRKEAVQHKPHPHSL